MNTPLSHVPESLSRASSSNLHREKSLIPLILLVLQSLMVHFPKQESFRFTNTTIGWEVESRTDQIFPGVHQMKSKAEYRSFLVIQQVTIKSDTYAYVSRQVLTLSVQSRHYEKRRTYNISFSHYALYNLHCDMLLNSEQPPFQN